MRRLLDRSTGDLLVLLIAATICLSVMAAGLTFSLLRLLRPEQDVGPGASLLSDTINTLIGLLAGFLAGRTDARREDSGPTGSADR